MDSPLDMNNIPDAVSKNTLNDAPQGSCFLTCLGGMIVLFFLVFWAALSLALPVMKLTGDFPWSWWWVLLPPFLFLFLFWPRRRKANPYDVSIKKSGSESRVASDEKDGGVMGVLIALVGMGVFGNIILLPILKWCSVIDWSWWWITSPLWGGLILAAILGQLLPDDPKDGGEKTPEEKGPVLNPLLTYGDSNQAGLILSQPGWICLGGSPERIEKAVREHYDLMTASSLTPDISKGTVRLMLYQHPDGFYALVSERPWIPYDFVNLLLWLGAPSYGLSGPVGWLTSPKENLRYCLTIRGYQSPGDQLMAHRSDGKNLIVYVPENQIAETALDAAFPSEPRILPESMQLKSVLTAPYEPPEFDWANSDFVITHLLGEFDA